MRGFLGARIRLQLESEGFWSPAFEWEAGNYEAGEREAPVVLRLYKTGQVVGPTSALKPAETGPGEPEQVRLRVVEILDGSPSLPDWAASRFDLPCEVGEESFSCEAPAGELRLEIRSGEDVLLSSRRIRVPAGQEALLETAKTAAKSQ